VRRRVGRGRQYIWCNVTRWSRHLEQVRNDSSAGACTSFPPKVAHGATVQGIEVSALMYVCGLPTCYWNYSLFKTALPSPRSAPPLGGYFRRIHNIRCMSGHLLYPMAWSFVGNELAVPYVAFSHHVVSLTELQNPRFVDINGMARGRTGSWWVWADKRSIRSR
jgi:hypothetical protein